jgi:hypothetical protein
MTNRYSFDDNSIIFWDSLLKFKGPKKFPYQIK